jgi:hypothetical protein
MTAALAPGPVADLLVVVGAIARIVDEADQSPEDRVASIRQALANIGIRSDQTRADRLASIRRACRR